MSVTVTTTPDLFAEAPRRWDVLAMFIGTTAVVAIGAPWYGWTVGYDGFLWAAFGMAASANNLSITAGYHRLWSHRTFDANIAVRVALALVGAFALQNSILKWASDHRRHHRFVDRRDRDHYSANRGTWFSHMGWMLRDYPSDPKDFSNVQDLLADPVVRWQHKHYLATALAMNLGAPLLIGLIRGDIIGALLLVGFFRLVVCHHTTFFINSLAHIWGTQPYSRNNTARDNPLIAVLTFGEGYHNFHHAFPKDYRNAIRWWQWDPTKWLIAALRLLGLARDLKTADPDRIQALQARVKAAEGPEPVS